MVGILGQMILFMKLLVNQSIQYGSLRTKKVILLNIAIFFRMIQYGI